MTAITNGLFSLITDSRHYTPAWVANILNNFFYIIKFKKINLRIRLQKILKNSWKLIFFHKIY